MRNGVSQIASAKAKIQACVLRITTSAVIRSVSAVTEATWFRFRSAKHCIRDRMPRNERRQAKLETCATAYSIDELYRCAELSSLVLKYITCDANMHITTAPVCQKVTENPVAADEKPSEETEQIKPMETSLNIFVAASNTDGIRESTTGDEKINKIVEKKVNNELSHLEFSVTATEVDDPIKQMRKLSRDWILTALNTPNSMQQIVIQLRHIVEGFWPFNNPLLMNVPHPDLVYIIAEELQQILVKCEAKTLGYPSVAAQPRSLPHFCNFVLLLGHFIVEFASLPYKMSDHLMDIAFRSTVLCLQPPLQWQLAHALFRLWRMAGREMEMHLSGFNVLVDGLRDAVLLGERARPVPLDGPDPKTLFVEALELRARGWRPQSKSGDGDRAGACSPAPVGDSSATALTEALARASLRVENLGAAGDCPRTAGLSGPGVLAL